MGSSSGKEFVHAVLYGMFVMHLCKQPSRLKCVYPPARLLTQMYEHKSECTNCLPNDEPTRFDLSINLKSLHFVGL